MAGVSGNGAPAAQSVAPALPDLGQRKESSRARDDSILRHTLNQDVSYAMHAPGSTSSHHHQIHVHVVRDPVGNPKAFTLTLGTETVRLEPGKSWIKTDSYKWSMRGLMEAPQSFHVLADGEVDVNGERVRLQDPDGAAHLERELNKHHNPPSAAAALPASRPASGAGALPEPISDRVVFRVHLDHLGHLAIEAKRGQERMETGMRGLLGLVHQGLMNKPGSLHVDPLQRSLELDGVRFECSNEGARALEAVLNHRYAPRLEDLREDRVEVHENPASPTGVDLSFPVMQAGTKVVSKGHLSQDKLDLLTDTSRCDLLRAGTVLRLSPPRLLFRRRRTDGGEEPIPELPDLDYSRHGALEIAKALNHSVLRPLPGGAKVELASAPAALRKLTRIRLAHHPQNRALLWMECFPAGNGPAEGRGFTHHNVAELQHHGVFRTGLDVTLSFDNSKLSVLDTASKEEKHLVISAHSSEQELAEAGKLLTESLAPA